MAEQSGLLWELAKEAVKGTPALSLVIILYSLFVSPISIRVDKVVNELNCEGSEEQVAFAIDRYLK